MQNYISSIRYRDVSLSLEDIVSIPVDKYPRIKIDPLHPSYADSEIVFDQEKFKYPYLPLYLGDYEIKDVESIDMNVLRLMIRANDENADIKLPSQLIVLKDFVLDQVNYHRQHYPANKNCFIYITVRSCSYDDLYYGNSKTWHIDGFQGARIDRHLIEQNAFWCNKCPTDFLLQPMYCEGLNASKHDINDFFDRTAKAAFVIKSKEKSVYFVNPYGIHRVSSERFEGKRIFVRLNFSPVFIEDSTNTFNPAFADVVFPKRRDVRDFLRSYTVDESVDSGFNFGEVNE